jgi:hypothetical protein
VGGGFWHQGLFSQEVFVPVAAGSLEAGAEVGLGARGYLFASLGASALARRVENFDGSQGTESFLGFSFRGGVGF